MSSIRAKLAPVLKRGLTPTMLVIASALFVAGVTAPFFNVTKFWIFDDAVSVVSGLVELARASEWFLFAVILLFTLIFPSVKLGALGVVWWWRGRDDEHADRTLRWVSHLGKWSMLDVLVVAILVVTIKAAQIAKISVESGVYLFTASVVITQLTSLRLERRLR
jgi:paraquat-inducible protein A